ncbi:MAG TPA: hypothetical protein VI759_07045 [Dehalococcoidia bacterium]|nr:hypothetical protein [Dehalococcoidia bacterium]
MSVLTKQSRFLFVLATLTAVVLGGLMYSSGVTVGAETDVAAPASAQPPQAPIDTNAADTGNVNALPDAGSGGYLNQDGNSSYYAIIASLGLALLAGGSLVFAYKQRK